MSEDVIQFPQRPGPAQRAYPTSDCDPNSPLPVAVAAAPSPEFAALDLDALFNMREWVRSALEAKGAKIVGSGIGCGGTMGIADNKIELEGHQCNIEIRPLSCNAP
jgi:hypothetical protein